MVLEQAIIFEADATNTSEDWTSHEVVCIRAKPIYNVMVIPNVDLWYRRVCRCEWLGTVPSDIVVKVVFVAVCSHLIAEGEVSSLVRTANIGPWFKWSIHSHAVIVNLVTATDHDMERLLLMSAKNIIPQSWTCWD